MKEKGLKYCGCPRDLSNVIYIRHYRQDLLYVISMIITQIIDFTIKKNNAYNFRHIIKHKNSISTNHNQYITLPLLKKKHKICVIR